MGLITAQLEQQVHEAARRHGVVAWFDPHGTFTNWTTGLAQRHQEGAFAFPVIRFQGSYLQLLLDAADLTKHVDVRQMIVHLAGLTPAQVRDTPALSVTASAYPLELDLKRLVADVATGRVEQERIDAALADPTLTLESADAWLEAQVSGRRTGLEAELERLPLSALVDALLANRKDLNGYPIDQPLVAIVQGHTRRTLGLTDAWLGFLNQGKPLNVLDAFDQATEAALSWALAVEYVHDLRRMPRVPDLMALHGLAAPLVGHCRTVAAHARDRHPDRYEQTATELEQRLSAERTGGKAEELGNLDTMRFEAQLLLSAAIEEVRLGRWQQAKHWCEHRVLQRSFWLQRNPRLGSAWDLVNTAVRLLEAMEAHEPTLTGCTDPDGAVEAYAAGLWEVDQAHRHLLQRAAAVLEPQLPDFVALRAALQRSRERWRTWADRLAKTFSQICRQNGFLPQPDRQQRTFFDQVVRPQTQDGLTALFLVDALRFEMAQELLADFNTQGATATLQPRLSELPSITAVGMNVLAPLGVDGVLTPAFAAGKFQGFRAGEFTVRDTETRRRAMHMRVGGTRLPAFALERVCDDTPDSLRQAIRGGVLVLVHSREIDDAGEVGAGVSLFDDVLRRLKIACRNLQMAGVRRFVFTADHGFLLQDDTAKVHPYGRTTDPDRRHVWSPDGQEQPNLVTVSATALRYEGVSGAFLMPEDTGVFDRGAGNRGNFVHGGNSLQERAIPVLVVRTPGQEATDVAYQLEAEAKPPMAGLQTVKVRVLTATDSPQRLDFDEVPKIEVTLDVPGRLDISIEIKGARPEDRWDGARLRLPIGHEYTELFFTLSGEHDSRVPLQVIAADNLVEVRAAEVQGLFTVAGRTLITAPLDRTGGDWLDRISDPGLRKVAKQLAQTRMVSETDLHILLGSPRAARKFALEFGEFAQLLPFGVHIEVTESGKVYKKS
jgi:hypothetical protein